MSVLLEPIGVVHTPFDVPTGTPIQPVYGRDAAGTVEVDPNFVGCLADLDGFHRIWLLVHLHRSSGWQPRVVPYRDVVERGLFSTRAPRRPNPIGLSVVTLDAVQDNLLRVRGVDVLDGTPLLDIKPYVPEFDAHPHSAAGWLDRAGADRRVADERFE